MMLCVQYGLHSGQGSLQNQAGIDMVELNAAGDGLVQVVPVLGLESGPRCHRNVVQYPVHDNPRLWFEDYVQMFESGNGESNGFPDTMQCQLYGIKAAGIHRGVSVFVYGNVIEAFIHVKKTRSSILIR